jgi:hypothetical protein
MLTYNFVNSSYDISSKPSASWLVDIVGPCMQEAQQASGDVINAAEISTRMLGDQVTLQMTSMD